MSFLALDAAEPLVEEVIAKEVEGGVAKGIDSSTHKVEHGGERAEADRIARRAARDVARRVGVSASVEGGGHVEARLAGIRHRLVRPQVAFGEIMLEMQATESRVFAGYGGKYVRTGALRASLTGHGGGAIRELTPYGFNFGSDVLYARFQGTRGVGRHKPPSAILKLEPEEVLAAEKTLLHYIMHGL